MEFSNSISSRKISTALAAGCSVICKPDTITPGAVMELVNICKEAGVPDGVVIFYQVILLKFQMN